MLLTATVKVENTGAEWDKRRAMLTNWGTAPTVIEPITGWIQLKDLEGAVGVFAQPLDGSARPIGPEIRGRMIERSEEHTSELQSLMRISYAVFCLKKQRQQLIHNSQKYTQ